MSAADRAADTVRRLLVTDGSPAADRYVAALRESAQHRAATVELLRAQLAVAEADLSRANDVLNAAINATREASDDR